MTYAVSTISPFMQVYMYMYVHMDKPGKKKSEALSQDAIKHTIREVASKPKDNCEVYNLWLIRTLATCTCTHLIYRLHVIAYTVQ